jgi:lysophospholipase L1-like esterase
MPNKKHFKESQKSTRLVVAVSLILFSLVLMIFVGEIFCYFYFTKKSIYAINTELGWYPKSNFSYRKQHFDIARSPYEVEATTDERGFREWGDPATSKLKVMFIGDSFTGNLDVSDEDAYYGQVKKLMDAEVFAVGAAGYGTLQEYLILKKYVSTIKPDYFILQFCSNDFVNNNIYLEGRSVVRNQKNLRPYLDEGKIVYRLSDIHWYRLLNGYSGFFRFLDQAFQMLQVKVYGDYYPAPTDEEKVIIHQEKIKAVQTTKRLLEMMVDVLPSGTEALTFTCSTNDEATEPWIQSAKSAGFTPLPEVSLAVEKAEKGGETVRASDGSHWGPKGHHIAGKVLVGIIEKLEEKNS